MKDTHTHTHTHTRTFTHTLTDQPCVFCSAAENLQKACAAVASYLLLRPDDETMMGNKKFYIQQPGVSEADFTPRKVSAGCACVYECVCVCVCVCVSVCVCVCVCWHVWVFQSRRLLFTPGRCATQGVYVYVCMCVCVRTSLSCSSAKLSVASLALRM